MVPYYLGWCRCSHKLKVGFSGTDQIARSLLRESCAKTGMKIKIKSSPLTLQLNFKLLSEPALEMNSKTV